MVNDCPLWFGYNVEDWHASCKFFHGEREGYSLSLKVVDLGMRCIGLVLLGVILTSLKWYTYVLAE